MNDASATARLDVNMVIAHLGGVSAVVEGLRNRGIDCNAKRVQKWRERGSIPMDSWLGLLVLQPTLDLRDFLTEASCRTST